MLNFFIPQKQSVWVSALTSEQLLSQLETLISASYQNKKKSDPLLDTTFNFDLSRRNKNVFRGFIDIDNSFKIYQNPHYPEYFLPLIIGRVEESSSGCIIFLDFKLFPGTMFFLVLTCFIISCLSFVFIMVLQNIFYFLIMLLCAFLAYTIMLLNFHLKIKQSESILLKVLTTIDETL